jgi:calcineurin-like phosphoesterase family protein
MISMGVFFTSDTHFGHHNIITYTQRPFGSVDEMNAGLVDRWNAVVGYNDEVWVLGDVCLGKIDDSLKLISRLNGVKHLLVGNHDRMFSGKNASDWETRYMDAGFVSITHKERLFSQETPFLMSHFPYRGDSGNEERFTESRPVDEGLILLHGHTHGRWRKNGRMIDVGVDAWGGRPVHLDEILELVGSSEDLKPLAW